ncbi:cytochrome P450 [Mycolicibacterium fallax]|uniref:Steroid C26-monooxygenase n=1 Tax=Mycolicibacterium fallax TaxID=1793 RepID=A0A1X1RDB4_MYCFA|nr:cytochrome P450 [Mycolicibacterium fallax]ORV03119.1 steroid C27-monooxygenase [Mycolicibacterium fallax]BBY98883.1 cytochrome P450 [Mycolicibacterium fallax]HOW93013.1 cytochrome P450 [Mycolicibacterium fallax]
MTSTLGCPFSSRPDGIDFVDPDVLGQGVPLREFAELRRNAPVWWNAQEPGTGGFTDGGFWVISRHADIKAISRDPDTWSANRKGVVISFFEGMDEEKIELTKALLINHDPPEHTRLRRIVSRLFAPRAVAELEEKLRIAARRIVAEAAESESGDFVADIAAKLPLQAIADLIGVPAEDHQKVFHWANSVINLEDPDAGLDDPTVANAQLLAYAYGMADERRRCPADDIVTKLVHADLDGEWMTQEEFGFFVVLLAVAGNETTRNAITHGLNAFLDHPEQWEIYRRDRPETAADEIVRWSTPVYAFQRTATRDVQLGGAAIAAGDRVGLFYASANFDDEVFENPHEFNVLRNPNPHLGFGGQGTHFCLGANLARTEINLMFNAIADVLPDITKLGEPRRLRSAWLNGVKSFDVRYR